MARTNRLSLLSSFKDSHIFAASSSASSGRATRSGSPSKLGMGLPSHL